MPHLPEDTDPDAWHRYFAMECNNRAWQLAVLPRTPADDLEMLNSAHAAAYHWEFAGSPINHMRAKLLLAEVHALLGLADTAFAYAVEVRAYFLAGEISDWEIAYVHAIHAHAAAISGETRLHNESYAAASAAVEAISDDEDRKLVLKTFDQVPPP